MASNTTNYPNGVSSFGIPVLGSFGGAVPTGKVLWVQSVHSRASDNNNGESMDSPMATLDAAIGRCAANHGDMILIGPGHAENVAAASSIAVDVAGVAIIGLGWGASRPTFTWTATGAYIDISEASCILSNIRCVPGIDEVSTMIQVRTNATDCLIDKCDHIDAGSSIQTKRFLLATSGASRLTMQNCRHVQVNAAAAAQVWINLVGTTGARIIDNTILMAAFASTTSYAIAATGTACTLVEIARNTILFTGGTITSIINLLTGSTGMICNNMIGSGTAVATAAAITADAAFVFENYWIDDAAASGILAPAAGTD